MLLSLFPKGESELSRRSRLSPLPGAVNPGLGCGRPAAAVSSDGGLLETSDELYLKQFDPHAPSNICLRGGRGRRDPGEADSRAACAPSAPGLGSRPGGRRQRGPRADTDTSSHAQEERPQGLSLRRLRRCPGACAPRPGLAVTPPDSVSLSFGS